jgi:hypothetical protein
MTGGLKKWLKGGQNDKPEVALEDVTPMHPDEYPAKNLKRKLDERRAQSDAVDSHPTGMPDGPGPLT